MRITEISNCLLLERTESISDALQKYKNQKNIYISYVQVPKLGIYPSSGHDETPLGIYCYPLKEIYKDVVNDTIPYASNQPYVVVLQPRPTAKILYLNHYSKSDFTKDMNILSNILLEIFDSNTVKEIINYEKYTQSGVCLWHITNYAATAWNKKGGPPVQVGWRKMFVQLGYAGVVDNGNSYIHEVEPTQAVFFTTSQVQLIEILPNNKKKLFIKLSGKESPYQLISILRKSPRSVLSIQNPSTKLLLVAIKQDPSLIKDIKNISFDLQLAAVKQNGNAIRYISDPNAILQMAAVNQDGNAIRYISNPNEDVQLAAVKNRSSAFKFIENPTEQVKWFTISSNGLMLKYIKNPSQEMQLAAINSWGQAIQYIQNPSAEMKLAAVKQYPGTIGIIKNPTDEMISIAKAAGVILPDEYIAKVRQQR